MASTEAFGGPSGNSFPLSQMVSADGAAPGTAARWAKAASVKPAAMRAVKARRVGISCSFGWMLRGRGAGKRQGTRAVAFDRKYITRKRARAGRSTHFRKTFSTIQPTEIAPQT